MFNIYFYFITIPVLIFNVNIKAPRLFTVWCMHTRYFALYTLQQCNFFLTFTHTKLILF